LPFAALAGLPGMSQFRTPYRFQIPAAVNLAIATAFVIAWWSKHHARTASAAAVALAGLVFADLGIHRLRDGFPLQTRTHHPVYETLASTPGSGILLEVPLGVRTGTDVVGSGETLTFHQPVHRRRLINGFAARAPLAALRDYRESPALMLLADEPPPAGDVAQDFERRLRDLLVDYVVVHPQLLSAGRRGAIMDLLMSTRELEPFYADEGIIVLRRVLRRRADQAT
jgi:hypothetical protein